jgi:hypothetical protein
LFPFDIISKLTFSITKKSSVEIAIITIGIFSGILFFLKKRKGKEKKISWL